MRLYYHEVDANRKLEQPGCISAIIYSNKGPYTSVINGRYVTADGLPIWPSVPTDKDDTGGKWERWTKGGHVKESL